VALGVVATSGEQVVDRHHLVTDNFKPGESYEYTSGAPLNTPSGMMGGSYQMESDRGEQFDIEIPTFSLDCPNQDVLLN